MLSELYLNIVVMSYSGELKVNKLFFMIPSLVLAVLINRLIFYKKFKKLD